MANGRYQNEMEDGSKEKLGYFSLLLLAMMLWSGDGYLPLRLLLCGAVPLPWLL